MKCKIFFEEYNFFLCKYYIYNDLRRKKYMKATGIVRRIDD